MRTFWISTGANIDEFFGRINEYGWAMAPEKWLWTGLRGFTVSLMLTNTILQKFPISVFIDCFSDGRSRAGVYCAANACIEQVIQHGEVDIFQAVKTVRRHRPQLVENMVSIYQQTFNTISQILSFISDRIQILLWLSIALRPTLFE